MKLRIGKEEEREPGPLVACNRLLFCSPIVLATTRSSQPSITTRHGLRLVMPLVKRITVACELGFWNGILEEFHTVPFHSIIIIRSGQAKIVQGVSSCQLLLISVATSWLNFQIC